MPQYMTIHRAPGLLPETWDENSSAIYAATAVRYVQAYVNLASGFIITIYDAPDRQELVEQFEEWGLPFDKMHEVQFSQNYAQLEQRLKQLGRI